MSRGVWTVGKDEYQVGRYGDCDSHFGLDLVKADWARQHVWTVSLTVLPYKSRPSPTLAQTSSLKRGVLISRAARPISDHGAEIVRKATEPCCHGGSKASSRSS